MKALVRMVKVPLQGWNRDGAPLVTMEVREGEFVLLLGNNGSGKSSQLKVFFNRIVFEYDGVGRNHADTGAPLPKLMLAHP